MIPREKMQEIVDKTDIVELVRSEGIALEKVECKKYCFTVFPYRLRYCSQ